ncbi:hypothetical protein FO519_000276 [Halicephalobus sp. NKZ332]|nr:hypothetical protein FO519_000276 [Halicephalobus sp. NKZ332]
MAEPSEANYVWNKDIQFAPIRSMSEFLTDTTRYEMPSFSDLPKLNNRIVCNLMHFQSNYFIFFFLTWLLLAAFQAKAFAIGTIIILLMITLAMILMSKDPNVTNFRSEHPYALLSVILVISYIGITYFSLVTVAVFTILVPCLLILVHASLRLRGLRNKLSEKISHAGIRDTVMYTLFRAFGYEFTP